MNLQERFLYHIWDEGHIQSELKTVSGKELRIIYPGHFNTNRGPDFINANISINKENLSGSIEIHLNHLDWLRHHHHEDHYYNSVVLHVVYEHNNAVPYTIKENGEAIEILELKKCLTDDINKLIDFESFSYPVERSDYCDLLSLLPTERIQAILSEYGKARFLGKVKRAAAALIFEDFDQILYQGIMEAIGYDKNKYNFLLLTQELKWKKLLQWYREGMKEEDLIAIMIVSTSLLSKDSKQISPAKREEILARFEEQAFFGAKINIDWQLFRIRPGNHPIHRIMAISAFLIAALRDGLLKSIVQLHDQNPPEKLYKAFVELVTSYNMKDKDIAPLGKSIIANIFLNIILPMLYLYLDKTATDAAKENVLKIYREFPALAENHITRFMGSKIVSKRLLPKAIHQQGMIELYNRFCQYHFCDQCVTVYKRLEA